VGRSSQEAAVKEIIVLGGYGRVGRQCVNELVETTRARVVVAGRNIQLAERFASEYGERTRAAYANAADPRTLQSLIPGAAAVVSCCGSDRLAALDIAVQTRVAFLGVTPTPLEQRVSTRLQEESWQGQVPVILHAGAIPGLPGVLAELLMRRFPSLYEIRIASTGPWSRSELAYRDLQELRQMNDSDGNGTAPDRSWRWRRLRWQFPEPIGTRLMRPARSLDLRDFVSGHCVDRLLYLEPDTSFIARGVQQVLQREQDTGFALVAEAYPNPGDHRPAERITLQAPDHLRATAAAVGALAQRILGGGLVGGFFTPREALNPATFLELLAKRGVQVESASYS